LKGEQEKMKNCVNGYMKHEAIINHSSLMEPRQ